MTLAADIDVTDDIALAAHADIILIATPAQSLRAAVSALAPHIAKAMPVIACAKGIERGTHKFMTEVIAEAAPDARPAILSGPSFAEDVARGLPTAVTLAAGEVELAGALAQALGSPSFRLYHTSDIRGVEIGGAAKKRAGDRGGNRCRQKNSALRRRQHSPRAALANWCGSAVPAARAARPWRDFRASAI